jgi:hypothetical protein
MCDRCWCNIVAKKASQLHGFSARLYHNNSSFTKGMQLHLDCLVALGRLLTTPNRRAVIEHLLVVWWATGFKVLTLKSHSSSRPPAVTAPNTVLLKGHHWTSSTSSFVL